jgi:hypothetical protein
MTLFWIKFTHTAIFIVESSAILYILYSGLFNIRNTWLLVAIVLVLAEVVVFVSSGLHCPLTKLAKQLGDKTGNDYVADIFLPEWFAPRIPLVCGALAAIGLVVVGIRVVMG